MKHYKLLFSFLFIVLTIQVSYSQSQWTRKNDMPSGFGRVSGVGFSIGTKGYVGTGLGGSMTGNDFWEWDGDPTSATYDTWIQKANCSSVYRIEAVGFAIGLKGYIGTGMDNNQTTFYNDIWEWDGDPASPAYNTWKLKTPIPVKRNSAVGFSIGTKGYIATGNNPLYEYYLNDIWEFDPNSGSDGTWTSKSPLPALGRTDAVGFSIGEKGYIGFGDGIENTFFDFYEFDPNNSYMTQWVKKADLLPRVWAVGFSICQNGYIVTGSDNNNLVNDCWKFDPNNGSLGTWNRQSDFSGSVRTDAVGFSIGNRGYVTGGGYNTSLIDLWEFIPFYTNTISPSSYCAGANISVPFSFCGSMNSGNIFTAQLSDASGSFVSPVNIGTLVGTTSGAINAFIPNTTPAGTSYRIRVFASNPNSISSDNGVNITITQVWTQKTSNLTSARSGAVAFTIGTKAYIGGGYTGTVPGNYLSEYWEWNQLNGVWTQKASIPGVGRMGAVGFAIGSYGYVGTGYNGSPMSYFNDFYQWDSTNNTWKAMAPFPEERTEAVGFAIGNKGYVGTGMVINSIYGGYDYKQDFYEFDPNIGNTGRWTLKQTFPGALRRSATGFMLNGKGYLGTGYSYTTQHNNYNDFFQFDPNDISNGYDAWGVPMGNWIQKSNLPGEGRLGATGFSINNKGYIATGAKAFGAAYNADYFNDIYEWDETTNIWIQKSNLTADQRSEAVGFSVSGQGYVATGMNGYNDFSAAINDLWEFSPCDVNDVVTKVIPPVTYCNGSSISVGYAAIGAFNSGNIFTAQLSDASGNFAIPVNIGTLTSTVSGTINAVIPSNVGAGANYRIRVISSAPSIIGADNGSNISISTNCGSYTFNGIDSRIQSPYGAGVYEFGIGNFTLEAWIKMDATSNGNRPILSKRSTSGFTGAFRFRIEGGTQLSLDISGTNTLSSTFASIYDGLCHHVAVTRSGSTITFYLDGVLMGTGINAQNVNSSATNLSIGYDPYDNISLKGNLDEVRIWNLARTQVEIFNNRSLVLAGNTNGLKSYFQMNETSGQSVYDVGTGQNSGWLGSDPLSIEAQDPVRSVIACYTPVLESSLSFDGVNDRVKIPHHAAYNIGSGDFTLEAWVKLQSTSNGAILSKRNVATDGFLFAPTATGTQLSLQLSGTTYLSGTFVNILNNTCHHVAVKRSGSTLTFYVDGAIKGTATSALSMNSSGVLYTGYDKVNNTSMNGNINEIRFWNAARTDAQISASQTSVLPDNTVNLIAYFKFNEPSGQGVIDASSTANNGTLGTLTTIYDSADPVRVATSCFSGDREAFDNEDIDANYKSKVSIYPNPFNQGINIVFNDLEEAGGQVSVLDINGKLLWEEYIKANEIKEFGIEFPTGVYIIHLKRNAKVETFKIVKLE